jgi:hypothetical protein
MSYERQDPVAFPSDRYGGVVDHVGDDVPIMFGGVAGGASVETVMRGSQGQQDGPFAVLRAHFAMILA